MKKQITEKQDIKKAKKVRKNKDIQNKQTETKARNRVFNKQNFFKVLIALVVLTSVLLSALLGVSKAEYFKTFSKKVNLDLKPDLVLEYYLYDYDDHTSQTTDDLKPEFGSYKNAEQITQMIKIGRPDSSSKMLQNNDTSALETVFYGKDIVYQIKIPVTETGYYTLNFTSEFIRFTNPALIANQEYIEQDYYTTSYREAVGCEVLNVENTNNYETYKFGTPTPLDLAERVFANKVFYEKQGYTADSAFQWKTLSPTRSESVKLSFKVNKEDVDNGYVVWMWELTGLRGNAGYTFSCDHLEIEKIMELDGSTSKRDSDAPYFMTPKTTITNAQIRVLGKVSDEEKAAGADGKGNYERRGSVVPGKTSYSDGRGSYVTEATPNSVGMRIETLNSGVLVNNKTTWYYDNPTSFQIPVKNIKYDTTYKVTFDFSVARQGNLAPSELDTSSKYDTSDTNMWDYTNYDKILNRTNLAPEFNSGHGKNENNSYFFSYLHDDIASLDSNKNIHNVPQSNSSNTIAFNATRITAAEHITGSQKLYYKYKQHQGEALTKYNGILDYSDASSSHNYLNMVSSTTVNDTYSIEYFNSGGDANLDSTLMRNHFNAVQHTEINGQVAINWLTFYNTTFSFNIDGDAHQKKDANGNLLYLDENGDETTTVTDKPAYNIDINNLNWVWAIDALEYECFYNIRIDNIRIQEVVEYSSMIDLNGLKIADKVESAVYDADHYGTGLTGDADASVFNNFKGYNNIGQNYQAKRNDTKTDGTKKHMSVGNIYAPIFDAKRMSAKAPQTADGKPHPDDYKIRLSGWAVLNGGVLKYVFSIDGGYTWYDMTFEGTSDSSADLFAKAQEGIHQNTYLQSYTSYGKGTTHDFYFDKQDALNDNFGNFALTADLTDFKNQADLDIIIAAVPYANEELRCEIIRIINYNSANTYVSKLDSISSDIETSTGILTVTNDKMAYNTATSGTSTHKKAHYYPVFERGSYDNRFSANSITSTNKPMAKSENIDFSTIRTTYSDIPVKTQLTLKGAILCSQGVYAYEYSIDGGKTWKECTYTMTGFTAGTDYYNKDYKADNEKYHFGENLMYKFITRNLSIGNKQNYMPSNSGKFSTDASAISIDLSAYKGQVVDIIVAAKPNYLHNYVSRYSGDPRTTDIHLPIAKIDNVAVYGATGTFYTHLNSVTIDGEIIEPTYLDVDDKPLNRVTKSTSDSTVTVTPQWDLGYSAKDGKEFSYTIFEPNNVNALHARLYNDKVNEVPSGAKVVIDGYTMIGGISHVNEYYYTLDSGETWNRVYTSTNRSLDSEFKAYAKQSDNKLTNANGSNYLASDTYLTFAIPALPDGTERLLTVVAKNQEGDKVPVLNIKLKIKGENIGYFYSNYWGVNGGDVVVGNYKNFSNISIDLNSSDNVHPKYYRYKMTFPVSKEGVHTLTFNAALTLDSEGAVSERTNVNIYQAWDWTARIVHTGYANTIKISVDKTDFMEGEDINVSYYADVRGNRTETGAGVLGDAVICIARLEDDGSLRVYEERKSDNSYGGEWPHYERAVYVVKGTDNIQNNMTDVRSGVVNLKDGLTEKELADAIPQSRNSVLGLEPHLPAGKYRIYFYNDESIRFGNVALGTTNSEGASFEQLLLTDPIDITIHSKDEYSDDISIAVLHEQTEKGGERYFASKEADKSKGGTVDSVADVELTNAFTAQDVDLYFNATAEDVKRGYVVLDWDFSNLEKDVRYTLNIKNLLYSYGVKSTKKLVTDPDGNASNIIRVPALEVGTHEFMFSSDTNLFGGPIVHLGIDQTVTLEGGVPGDAEGRDKGGNYRAAGAYMSVEKNVFNVGEPIHVSYCSAGTVTTSNTTQLLNAPRIGIAKTVNGKDVWVGWVDLPKNNIGAVTIKGNMGGCDDSAKDFAHLPEGDYKIYFRDCSSLIHRPPEEGSTEYRDDWPEINMTDPIAIKIVNPKGNNNDKPYKYKYEFNDVWYKANGTLSNYLTLDHSKVSGWFSLDRTVFYKGEAIDFSYYFSERVGGPDSDSTIWVGIRRPNEDGSTSHLKYVYMNGMSGNASFSANDLSALDAGQYQLVVTDYNFEQARIQGSIMAVMDIVILPAEAKANPPQVMLNYGQPDDNEETPTVFNPCSSSVPAYGLKKEKVSITVTEEDVKRGYVEFKYELNNLVPNTEVFYSTEMFYDKPIPDVPYTREGDYIYFGEYPQSLKLPDVNITSTVPNERGYYKGDDGYYYAKVIAKPYGGDYMFDNGTVAVEDGEIYYFKVEPIQWRVLDEGNGYFDIICTDIIANHAYDNDSNNYANSSVREWLNDTFYKTAFSEFQKEYIMESTVDNSVESTGYASNSFTCANTTDKIYLPSYAQVTNPDYGFSSDPMVSDPYRAKKVTDYARATGAWTNMSMWDGNTGNGIWMLRSPADSENTFIREGYYLGEITDGGINVNITAHGVAPMLKLSYSKDAAFYEEYITIEKEVGNKDIYRANYSAYCGSIFDSEVTRYAFDSDFAGSYMRVDKTYFLPGEPINVTYFATGSTINHNAWICIADLEMDQYIYWSRITKGTETEIDLSQQHSTNAVQNPNFPTLEPGKEYKIWLLANDYWWDYSKDGDAHYMNPYKDGKIVNANTVNAYTVNAYAITEPICIKILDPNENDYSLEYKAWIGADTNGEDQMGATYSHIMLERNTFLQGEPIKMKFNGRIQYMWAWLCDENGNEITNTHTGAVDTIKKHDVHQKYKNYQYLADWTEEYYEMENSKNLDPGKYKLYYAVYTGNDGMGKVYDTGAIVTILDITILSPNEVQSPTLKLDVVYTNTSGQTVRQTINNNVVLDNLLNSHPGNYDLTDDDNKIEGIVELTDVMPNTVVQFVFSYKKDGEINRDDVIEIAVDEASAINDIEYSTSSNFAVEHQAFSYVPTSGGTATTNYPDSKLSLPSMYFEYGEPIEVSYKVPSNSGYRVVVTKEFFNKGETDDKGTPLYDKYVIAGKNLYATVCIKYKTLSSTEGMVNLNQANVWNSPFLQENHEIYSGNLPVGTYKVWLVKADADMLGWIDDKTGAVHGHAFAQDPYTYIAPNMVTEPITINVVNPEDPNFGIMSNVYSVNNGKNQVAGVEKHDSTRIGIDKTTFVQGERIYFHIQLDYSFRHIMLMKADLSITDVANEPTKGNYDRAMYGKTWRYAVDGYTNGEDFLDTTGLEPGHYKLYYLMGRDLQAAIRGDRFYHDGDPTLAANETYSELLTVIDIIILPKGATQTLTVTYTKYDGTTATVTESFPMTGKALGTELHNDKLLTKYHSGIDFVKIVTDAQPGTSFVFTVTTNFNAASDEVKKYFEDRFTCTVLKESVIILS